MRHPDPAAGAAVRRSPWQRLVSRWRPPPDPDPVADDWACWRRACAGDAQAARVLVRHLTPQALGLARQLLRRDEDAQDMVQTAFMRLWQSRPSDAAGARLATYFNTIVINRCRTLLVQRRELAMDPASLHELLDAGACPPSSPAADQPDASLSRALAHALQQLPARQRLALAMWAYGDASAGDIAQALDIDTNAAHQLLHRAKQALKRRWSAKEPP